MIHDVQERLQRFDERCAAAGIPLTAQRRAVMEALASRTDHPSVEQIHSAVVRRLPDVSKATVYRALETLRDLGLVERVHHPGSAVRFDANTEPHHHFLCTSCGSISDLPLGDVDGSDALAYVGAGEGVAEDIVVLVRGVCAECAAAQASA